MQAARQFKVLITYVVVVETFCAVLIFKLVIEFHNSQIDRMEITG